MRSLSTPAATLATACAAVLAVLASPPALGTPFAVLLALGALAAVLARARCPLRLAMLYFAISYGCYAWSLGYVSRAGWAMIVFLGSLYGALFAFALRGVAQRAPALYPLAFGAAWTAVEALRSHWPGIAWQHAQLASFFYETPELLRGARYVGEAGCNFCVASLGASAASLLGFAPGRRGGLASALAVSLFVAGSAWGVAELEADGAPIELAVVQTGIPAYADQERAALRAHDALYTHYRELATRIPECELALWPETALSGVFFEEGEGERRQLRPLLPLFGAARGCVIGALRVPADAAVDPLVGPAGFRNVAYYLGRAGEGRGAFAELRAVHEKSRLVPGGETLPFWLAWLRSYWPHVWRSLPGRAQELARLPDGRGFGMPICYENCFPSRFADDAARGAGFFTVLSFEGWYRQGWELEQMLAMTVLRALETGRPILRSTSDGVSCAVRPDGSVDAIERGLRDEVRVFRVQPRAGQTLAMWLGPLVPWGAALLALALRLLAGRRRREAQARES